MSSTSKESWRVPSRRSAAEIQAALHLLPKIKELRKAGKTVMMISREMNILPSLASALVANL